MMIHSSRGTRALLSTLILAASFTASAAHAQDATKKKKPKPAPAAEAAPVPAPVEPTPTPAETTPPPAPVGAEPEKEKATEEKKEVVATAEWDDTDVFEKSGKTYYFLGARYVHTVIPKFMINLFVDEGATFASNSIGASFEIRKDGFSIIPTLAYTEYGTGDVLFHQKNTPDIPGNYSMVNSSLKAIYFQADLLWSSKIAKNWDIEYGGGVGIGALFGDLENNWVHQTPNGTLTDSQGRHWSQCATTRDGPGCATGDHQNATTAKVGGYTEPSWANGGSKPNIFPHLAIPQIGVRFKPVKEFEARAMVGFSLTGFFFGLSASYGFEKPKVEITEEKK